MFRIKSSPSGLLFNSQAGNGLSNTASAFDKQPYGLLPVEAPFGLTSRRSDAGLKAHSGLRLHLGRDEIAEK
jgi:hypothetical protein